MLQKEFWRQHYSSLHPRISEVGASKSMDYPNDRLQTYTYAQILEALGQLNGKSLLDAGCGWGVFSLIAHHLGASVTGLDYIGETIATLQSLHPTIHWVCGDFSDPLPRSTLGVFDRVAAVEVLQYVDFHSGVTHLWETVAPGGRLAGCVPNSLCPFSQSVHERRAQWIPVSPSEIQQTAHSLPGCFAIYMRGLTYLEDQTFLPYAASDWKREITGTPNRIVFALLRE